MTLRLRLFLLNALLVLGTVGAMLGMLYRAEKALLSERSDAERGLAMARLAGVCRDTLESKSEQILLKYLRHSLDSPEALGAGLWDLDGRVYAHSDFLRGDFSRVGVAGADAFLREANSAKGPLSRLADNGGRRVLRMSSPVSTAEGRFGSVIVDFDLARSDSEAAAALGRAARSMALAGLLALAAGMAAAALSADALAKPLRELRAAARRMGEGSLEEIPADRGDEVGGLARDLNDMARRLRQVDRARDQLLHGMSHDMRTPLAVLQSSLYHARRALGTDPKALEEDFLDMERALHDLVKFVNNILDLAKLQSGRMKLSFGAVDLAEALEEARQAFRRVAEDHGLSLKVSAGQGLPLVRADREFVGRVLANLLMNAVKFTPAGGRVSAGAEPAPSGAGGGGSGRGVRVWVADSGIGIPKERLSAVFERFEQAGQLAGRATTGTGLGLAICKEVVERHGGRIWVESEPGKGSVFQFILPVEGPPDSRS